MAQVKFLPGGESIEVNDGSKLLAAAVKAKVDIRYGCGALRCGTCAIKVVLAEGEISFLTPDEKAMLERLKLPVDGSVRMACRAKANSGKFELDLSFQDTYSP